MNMHRIRTPECNGVVIMAKVAQERGFLRCVFRWNGIAHFRSRQRDGYDHIEQESS